MNSKTNIILRTARIGAIATLIGLIMPMSLQAYVPQIIRVDTEQTSLIMGVGAEGYLHPYHYGEKIEDAAPFLEKNNYRRWDSGDMAYLSSGGRNFRYPALQATYANGDVNTELVYVGHTAFISDDPNVVVTEITLRDKVQPLEVRLIIKAYWKENVVTEHVVIRNTGEGAITLHSYYSAYLLLMHDNYYLSHFYGKWSREMTLDETQLTHGIKSIENRKGMRTAYGENPAFLLSLNKPLDEDHGEVIGGALAWSGSWKISFEVDEHDMLGICAGINPFASEYKLAAGASLETPEMIFTFSDRGAGGVSRSFHDWARNYGVYDAQTMRPTLLNSWEGAGMDFDEKTLTDMIDDAAEMGLELFVLDDGWFGNKYPRNAPNAALGDWQANKSKLPRGIGYIADYAASKGLRFGIWIEPEMVSPKSELAEKHPEWIVKSKGREIFVMRDQWLLDLTNPEVQDFVFGVFDSIMQISKNISYIKWDCNRHAENMGSEYLADDKQSHFSLEYNRGLYRVYERIREKYPHVIIQACASGGGRVDYGSMRYHQEVWTSDNTDAISRIKIQYGMNMIYPTLVTGSHVSNIPNDQTGNMTPLKYRFEVAMTGRLGLELQPKDMSGEEKTFAKMAIASYKTIRDIVMYGDLYRINSPYDNTGFYSQMNVSKDKTRAVLFIFATEYRGRPPLVRLKGLDPKKHYRLTELNVQNSEFWANNLSLSGEYLMYQGLNPKLTKNLQSSVFYLEEVDK